MQAAGLTTIDDHSLDDTGQDLRHSLTIIALSPVISPLHGVVPTTSALTGSLLLVD